VTASKRVAGACVMVTLPAAKTRATWRRASTQAWVRFASRAAGTSGTSTGIPAAACAPPIVAGRPETSGLPFGGPAILLHCAAPLDPVTPPTTTTAPARARVQAAPPTTSTHLRVAAPARRTACLQQYPSRCRRAEADASPNSPVSQGKAAALPAADAGWPGGGHLAGTMSRLPRRAGVFMLAR
jgi:hypothetical protein